MSFKEKREYEMLEKEMAELEKEKQELTNKMNGGITNYDELQMMANCIAEITNILEQKEMKWLELSEMIQ